MTPTDTHARATKEPTKRYHNPHPLSKNEHLLRWVEKMAELTASRTRSIGWMARRKSTTRSARRWSRREPLSKLNEELWPGCYYARSDANDVARVEDRTFICSLSKDSAGPTNNWVNPFEMRRKLKDLFERLDARADDVRAAVQHGPGRFADVADRRATHRFALRGGQHAHHGAHRPAGFREIDKDDEARGAVHAQRGRAAGAGTEGCSLAVQRREVHRALSRRRARSGRTARATAATRCWARNASRCASRRTSRATKAGWPSTC